MLYKKLIQEIIFKLTVVTWRHSSAVAHKPSVPEPGLCHPQHHKRTNEIACGRLLKHLFSACEN